jgi:hypothetical protein
MVPDSLNGADSNGGFHIAWEDGERLLSRNSRDEKDNWRSAARGRR